MLSALLALAGIVFSVVVSSLLSRRSLYINAVTVERSKWIEKLRSNLAEYCAETSALESELRSLDPNAELSWQETSEDLRKTFRAIDRLDSLIRLQLNPGGKVDANLIILFDVLPEMIVVKDFGGMNELHRLVIRHSQWLLKEEWEKVKVESGGTWTRLLAYIRARKRRRLYDSFCATGDGSFSRIVTAIELSEQRRFGRPT